MTITVKLFVTLLKFGPEIQEMKVPDGTTVADVIQEIRIPKEIPLLRIVNGVHVPPDYLLKESDVLALFPPIAGGTEITPLFPSR